MGYHVIRVQVEGVKGYDKDQVALVIPDSNTFGSRIPVILGTPTINQIVNIIKEHEIDELSVSLNRSRIFHLLARHCAEFSVTSSVTAHQTLGLTYLNKAVKLTKREEIDAFSSEVIHSHTKTMFLSNSMYVMTQAPEKGEVPCLPHGLSMLNTYTQMTTGSR